MTEDRYRNTLTTMRSMIMVALCNRGTTIIFYDEFFSKHAFSAYLQSAPIFKLCHTRRIGSSTIENVSFSLNLAMCPCTKRNLGTKIPFLAISFLHRIKIFAISLFLNCKIFFTILKQ